MSNSQAKQRRSIFPQIIHSLNHLLHQCFLTKNLIATKTLHARLLRTTLLFTYLNLHIKLILTYATCPSKVLYLTKLLNSMNQTSPLTWNALISCFSRQGFPSLALQTFSHMHNTNLPLDTYTLCSTLSASASTKTLQFGKQIHNHVEKSGWYSSIYVGGALIDFYSKSSAIEDAYKVFDEIPMKNIVCVNALLSGYAEAKLWIKGLHLIHWINTLSLDPDQFTLSAILRVCTGLSAIGLGRQVHAYLVRRITYFEGDVFLQCSLVEMYGKCGLVGNARRVFDLSARTGGERKRDLVLWTSMLCVYGRNGRFEDVIETYGHMLSEGVAPDEISFVAVLSACSHTGHVSQGLEYFESMVRDFGMIPGPEHYGCVVNLLCRAGELDRAWKLISEMPFVESSSSVTMWGALLNACRDCGNIEMGKVAAKRALALDPENVGIYVELSNLYASVDMWGEIGELRELMKERGLKKDVGCSWVEITR